MYLATAIYQGVAEHDRLIDQLPFKFVSYDLSPHHMSGDVTSRHLSGRDGQQIHRVVRQHVNWVASFIEIGWNWMLRGNTLTRLSNGVSSTRVC